MIVTSNGLAKMQQKLESKVLRAGQTNFDPVSTVLTSPSLPKSAVSPHALLVPVTIVALSRAPSSTTTCADNLSRAPQHYGLLPQSSRLLGR